MEEDDDGRREAAIASVPSLQPNFTSKKGLNPAQISKFQELHRRRLKIKARSKVKDKSKEKFSGTLAEVGKYHGKDVNAKCKEAMGEKSIKIVEDSRITLPISSLTDLSSSQEDNLVGHSLSKKRQKLHWGYDLSKCLLLLEQTIGFNAIANLTVWYHKCGILA
ncbi:uncharacterized protein [Nicotiana tomentosiformis]|uniref:uncharacterized protein isoform X3 n=1 Tax=Nicotiana tomentosiformis TaxID=4098 RepID=UPI000878ED0A|nr:uncharacterized protein LOC104104423 isoform X3 [Nicotiana tomentosiformis]